jgi:hypothetical protein
VYVNRSTTGGFCCLLISVAASCSHRPPSTSATTLHASPDSVQLVTTDILRFWKAFDDAAGKDSATRVRIFADEYLAGGSVGLQDFARIKLKGRGKDSTVTPAEELAHATTEWPRFYAGIRASSMEVATTDTVVTVVRKGLRTLAELYPEGHYPDVYFVIGRLNSAGTASSRGMLIGTEMSSRTSTTPVDEIPAWVQEFTSSVSVATLGHIVIHETVHFLQLDDGRTCCRNLLHDALVEGGADFLSELATGPWLDSMSYHKYGRAHENEVWREFALVMHDTATSTWIASGSDPKNHGAPDLGYWVGYRICQSYYERATDKRRAVRDLVLLKDPDRILRESGYGVGWR